nr:MAG TPA: Nucleotide modification associated domain 1 [Bacteriophage sp.]
MKKKQINDVPADVSAKMKELAELAEKSGVSLFAMAITGRTFAHVMVGEWEPIAAGLVTMGRRHGSVRGIISGVARILNGDLTDDFERVTREMRGTWKAKNADYGSSFDDGVDRFGLVSAAVRICDKANRFASLADGKKANVKGEALRDTLMDLANYSVMTVMRLDREKGDE